MDLNAAVTHDAALCFSLVIDAVSSHREAMWVYLIVSKALHSSCRLWCLAIVVCSTHKSYSSCVSSILIAPLHSFVVLYNTAPRGQNYSLSCICSWIQLLNYSNYSANPLPDLAELSQKVAMVNNEEKSETRKVKQSIFCSTLRVTPGSYGDLKVQSKCSCSKSCALLHFCFPKTLFWANLAQ